MKAVLIGISRSIISAISVIKLMSQLLPEPGGPVTSKIGAT
jgi:hypothetical protein